MNLSNFPKLDIQFLLYFLDLARMLLFFLPLFNEVRCLDSHFSAHVLVFMLDIS